jgi:ubiquinone biosynthesis protein COQ9
MNSDFSLSIFVGSDFLTYQEHTTIFRHAFKYIKDSKRFTNCLNDLKNQHTSPKVFILLSFLSKFYEFRF